MTTAFGQRRRQYILLLGSGALLAALVLAGCASRSPASRLRLGVNASAIASGLPFVAAEQNTWSKEDLTVTVAGFAAGKLALDALDNGSVDIATVAETPITLDILRGHDLVILGTISLSPFDVLMRKDKGLSSLQALHGKRIGTFIGSSAEFVLDTSLERAGLSPRDIQLTNLPPPELVSAFVRGDLDAISIWQPFSSMAQDALGDRAVAVSSEGFYNEHFNLVTTRSYLNQHRKTVTAFLRGILRAEVLVTNNPGAARESISRATSIPAGPIAAAWPRFRLSLRLYKDLPALMQQVAGWATSRDSTFPVKAFKPEDHIDATLLKALDATRVDN